MALYRWTSVIKRRLFAAVGRYTSSREFLANGTMAENNVEVSVSQGKLRGVVVDNIAGGQYFAFRGIPYAKPPVGQLRFKDPVPLEPWTGVRDASKYGDNCAQHNLITRQIIGSDDCLYLNVYTNSMRPTTKRAVMVWIHGGGFENGSGDDDLYGPDYLITKDIVLVTINYRLGVLGFLNLDDEVAPGNQGLKDQVMALRWIQENIMNFGGDEKNVTIFGESAGGASVHYLCVSAMANGLFHKAILQSGVLANPWATIPEPKKYALQLASILGENSTDPKVIVEFLRKVDCKKLIEVQKQLIKGEAKLQFLLPFGPTNDSKSSNPFLPKSKAEAIRMEIKVPIIIGYTSHEGLFFLSYNKEFFEKDVKAKNKYELFNSGFEKVVHPEIVKQLKEENVPLEKFKHWYFGDAAITEEQAEKYAEMLTDLMFVNGIYKVINVQMEKRRAPIFLYQFSYYNETSLINKLFNIQLPGAAHGSELSYIFYPHMGKMIDLEPHKPGTADHKVMSHFVQLWTDFAKAGHPTPANASAVMWEPLKNTNDYNYLDISDKLQTLAAARTEQRFEWNNIKHKL